MKCNDVKKHLQTIETSNEYNLPDIDLYYLITKGLIKKSSAGCTVTIHTSRETEIYALTIGGKQLAKILADDEAKFADAHMEEIADGVELNIPAAATLLAVLDSCEYEMKSTPAEYIPGGGSSGD